MPETTHIIRPLRIIIIRHRMAHLTTTPITVARLPTTSMAAPHRLPRMAGARNRAAGGQAVPPTHRLMAKSEKDPETFPRLTASTETVTESALVPAPLFVRADASRATTMNATEIMTATVTETATVAETVIATETTTGSATVTTTDWTAETVIPNAEVVLVTATETVTAMSIATAAMTVEETVTATVIALSTATATVSSHRSACAGRTTEEETATGTATEIVTAGTET